MRPAGVVEALDEAEDFPPCGLAGRESLLVEEFAFERREETLAHGVVVRVARRSHRLTDAGLAAKIAESDRRVLRSLDALMFVK